MSKARPTRSQEDAILNHLQAGLPLTPIEALRLYGCFRLSARIYDLRRQGFPIKATIIRRDYKHFCAYSLSKAP